jgi:serine/threonine protein kinase
MSQDTADSLLASLQRYGLLGPEELLEARQALAPSCRTAASLAEKLVEVDWLTPYQMEHLLNGEWGEVVLGPFQILEKLGEGGVCGVFKAWDTSAGKMLALKLLHPHLEDRPEAVAAFQAEGAIVRQLSHPNIIKALSAGVIEDRHYYAMELLEGQDLDQYVQKSGPLSVSSACDFIRQAAQGLQAAHQASVVHRDIKPANLYLGNLGPGPALPGPSWKPQGEPVVKVIDWGLARLASQAGEPHGGPPGQLLGTADYMAPEQIRDSSLVDIRADIYSLGCSLFYLLAAAPPFAGGTVMQKILQHQESPPPSLKRARPDVPDELDGMVQRMLAKRPEDRPQIPLLLVNPLRRIAQATQGLAPVLPGEANGQSRPTQLNLNRPSTQSSIVRPTSILRLNRPGS